MRTQRQRETDPWELGTLFRKRLDTWSGRGRDEEPPTTWSHWTSFGTIRLKPTWPLGILQCAVMLDDRYVATFHHPVPAAYEIGRGRLDKELGFGAKAGNVPDDLARWTGSNS